ncbi:phosphonoacetaldehyde hydrolase [Desulfolutivibrio sulfoxidireducens]|uniref:phosphonoacetaldehyde hydrolase n=1 Tax=Desulfolutivibrio sulfoxidireducens TaxID=2773299 RepID=UPI00159E8818|nr:phosphonoacetaldehyde hydrolase [Desulfolutivibrio sulfoxidireducens]QLA16206.1 phosphonoacetaldehyde hydrolase [Desulfolutivibrio sulfoxidireducens]
MDIFIRNTAYTGPVRAVILDWAGSAVDFGCMGPVAVFLEVFDRRGVPVTIPEARAPMGLMKKDHVRAMCRMPSVAARWREAFGRDPDESDVEDMYAETEPLMVDMIARHADPVPGLLDAVAAFRDMGLQIGSTTGYTRPMMEVLMPLARERGYAPDFMACPTDAPAGRPYPFMCWQNAIALGVYPLEAVVKIGDTVSDVHEGLNAGMWTVALTESGNEMGFPEAELARMDPEKRQERLEVAENRLVTAGTHFLAKCIGDCPAIIEEINSRLAFGDRP